MVARQFGLCQSLPTPCLKKLEFHTYRGNQDDTNVVGRKKKLNRFIASNEYLLGRFTPCFLPSHNSVSWCSQYYNKYHSDLAEHQCRMNNVIQRSIVDKLERKKAEGDKRKKEEVKEDLIPSKKTKLAKEKKTSVKRSSSRIKSNPVPEGKTITTLLG
ncbi:hypothetical protein RIF29_38910 [Crotalaria pallida]|uniref:Uncharacterized protein n=1 Tax=Crotalaria pallida TaxID=3830 RepID=A0AAN9E2P4_CROPI